MNSQPNQQPSQQSSQQSQEGRSLSGSTRIQYSTFYVANRLYGVDVTKVQEIVKPMPITRIPLADRYIQGLLNLRGQVVTAVSLHELFKLNIPAREELMNVICRGDSGLISLQVDTIGDVLEFDGGSYEPVPNTVAEPIHKFLTRIYKSGPELLSVLDVDQIFNVLNG
jgi:purine-binding chemotaxis protein CheW